MTDTEKRREKAWASLLAKLSPLQMRLTLLLVLGRSHEAGVAIESATLGALLPIKGHAPDRGEAVERRLAIPLRSLNLSCDARAAFEKCKAATVGDALDVAVVAITEAGLRDTELVEALLALRRCVEGR